MPAHTRETSVDSALLSIGLIGADASAFSVVMPESPMEEICYIDYHNLSCPLFCQMSRSGPP